MDGVFREATEKIPRPDRGLELVETNESPNEGVSTWIAVAPPVGLEPTTHGLGNRRSIL
jgi:hypothetical protein